MKSNIIIQALIDKAYDVLHAPQSTEQRQLTKQQAQIQAIFDKAQFGNLSAPLAELTEALTGFKPAPCVSKFAKQFPLGAVVRIKQNGAKGIVIFNHANAVYAFSNTGSAYWNVCTDAYELADRDEAESFIESLEDIDGKAFLNWMGTNLGAHYIGTFLEALD